MAKPKLMSSNLANVWYFDLIFVIKLPKFMLIKCQKNCVHLKCEAILVTVCIKKFESTVSVPEDMSHKALAFSFQHSPLKTALALADFIENIEEETF